MGSLDPFHRCRHPLQCLIERHAGRLERRRPLGAHDRPNGEALVRC